VAQPKGKYQMKNADQHRERSAYVADIIALQFPTHNIRGGDLLDSVLAKVKKENEWPNHGLSNQAIAMWWTTRLNELSEIAGNFGHPNLVQRATALQAAVITIFAPH